MSRITETNFLIFLLLQFSFLITTSALHDSINVKITYENEIIDLTWKQTGQYVANKNLPVWYAEKDQKPYLLPHVMQDIGDFVTYHDIEKSSAVVFFTKFNFFYGVVDTKFYILRLPLGNIGETIYADVGGDYVFTYEKDASKEYFHNGQTDNISNLFSEAQVKFINSLIDSMESRSNSASSSISSPDNFNGHQTISNGAQNTLNYHQNAQTEFTLQPNFKPNTLYPEVLVFITRDVYKVFTQAYGLHGIHFLVMYYIVYFNAIDMLFSKLTANGISIHMNIAGLVIEDDPRVFLYTIEKVTNKDGTVEHRLRDGIFLFRLPHYIRQHPSVFPEDSFDLCFVSTTYGMKRKNVKYHGVSRTEVNVYRQRYLKRPIENLLGTIVQSNIDFSDYVTATREIAQLMGIEHDPFNEGVHVNDKQCYAIMQKSMSHCKNCLTWSEKSRDELITYTRYNRNHCFLLNYPRSLYPYDQPIYSISPEDQCMCYQFPIATLDVFYMVSIPEDSCHTPMRCVFDQDPDMVTPWPLDGTPCGSGGNKVCWKKQCVQKFQ